MTSSNSGDDRGLDTPIPDWNLGSWRHSSWKQILAFLRKMAALREMAGAAA
jgi:hypothetical protein